MDRSGVLLSGNGAESWGSRIERIAIHNLLYNYVNVKQIIVIFQSNGFDSDLCEE